MNDAENLLYERYRINFFSYNGKEHEVMVTDSKASIRGIGTVETSSCFSTESEGSHCCGLTGFGALGDECPACRSSEENYDVLRSLSRSIEGQGGIRSYYESSSHISNERMISAIVEEIFDISNKVPDFLRLNSRLDGIVADAFAKNMKTEIFSRQDKELIERYFNGMHVFVFKYEGDQQHVRSDIDHFAASYCCGQFEGIPSVPYTELITENPYFKDVRKAVFMKDFYGKQMLSGMFETREYLRIIHSPLYQSHVIIPKMKESAAN